MAARAPSPDAAHMRSGIGLQESGVRFTAAETEGAGRVAALPN